MSEGPAPPREPAVVWTVGHSTRSTSELLDLLREAGIEAVADVRRFAGSRRHPQFAAARLGADLEAAGISYRHLPDLGGRRPVRPDSRNTAWRNRGFRGYADHMQSTEWLASMDELLALARRRRTAVMCAEAVWWRCHRQLIADWLKARGVQVVHLLGEGRSEEHPYTKAARVVGGRLSYEGEGEEPELF